MAHPDDETFIAGGTISAAIVEAGFISVTRDQRGSDGDICSHYGTATIVVTADGPGAATMATVAAIAPGIFTGSANRSVIQFKSSRAAVTPSQAANAGDVVVIYGTGTGPLTITPGTGQAAGSGINLSTCASTVSVTMDHLAAKVPFCGLTPGIADLMQVNVEVPAGLPAGDVQVTLTIRRSISTDNDHGGQWRVESIAARNYECRYRPATTKPKTGGWA